MISAITAEDSLYVLVHLSARAKGARVMTSRSGWASNCRLLRTGVRWRDAVVTQSLLDRSIAVLRARDTMRCDEGHSF